MRLFPLIFAIIFLSQTTTASLQGTSSPWSTISHFFAASLSPIQPSISPRIPAVISFELVPKSVFKLRYIRDLQLTITELSLYDDSGKQVTRPLKETTVCRKISKKHLCDVRFPKGINVPTGKYEIEVKVFIADYSSMRKTVKTRVSGVLSVERPEGVGVRPDERVALIKLYDDLNGDKWTNNYNWGYGDPCLDGWFGVWCRKINGRFAVTEM